MKVMKAIHFLVAVSRHWIHLCNKGKDDSVGWLQFSKYLFPCFSPLVSVIRYLQKEKANGPEGSIVMYELAERALEDSISIKIKDYIAQVHEHPRLLCRRQFFYLEKLNPFKGRYQLISQKKFRWGWGVNYYYYYN